MDIHFPGIDRDPISSVSAAPAVKIFDDPAENGNGRDVLVVENHGIPSFPNVPERDEHNVDPDLGGEVQLMTNAPWLTLKTFRNRHMQASPDSPRSWTGSTDVVTSLDDA